MIRRTLKIIQSNNSDNLINRHWTANWNKIDEGLYFITKEESFAFYPCPAHMIQASLLLNQALRKDVYYIETVERGEY